VPRPWRVVLDTNVVVSGLLRRQGSPPARILDAVVDNLIQLLLDERILTEYAEVLVRPRLGLHSVTVANWLAQIQSGGEFVTPDRIDLRLADPADLAFVEVAVAGGADYLITGNGKHFAPAQASQSIAVLTPREFIELL
jgi:putative PIN family toxin of toxin-antitoxin system